MNPSKPWYRSTTVLLNVLALVSLAVPAVSQWVKNNPVEPLAVLGAINVLVRFATQGKITLFSGDEDSSGNGSVDKGVGGKATGGSMGAGPGGDPFQQRARFLSWLIVAACACCFFTSCDTLGNMPIAIGIEGEHGTYGYSSKGGLSVTVKTPKVRAEKSALDVAAFNRRLREAFGPVPRLPLSPAPLPSVELWDPVIHPQPRRLCLP